MGESESDGGRRNPRGLDAADCSHHWWIDSPRGPTSIGTCKLCGEQREFRNSMPTGRWHRAGDQSRGQSP